MKKPHSIEYGAFVILPEPGRFQFMRRNHTVKSGLSQMDLKLLVEVDGE